MNTARTTGLLAQSSRGFVDWFTGTGFLTVNALGFFTALVILIPWNVYSNPGDFWSADILVRWAFILGFHALLVGVWSLIRNVILKDDSPMAQMSPSARQWQAARVRSGGSPISFRTPPSSNPVVTNTASALLAEEWARQWVNEQDSASEYGDHGPDAHSPAPQTDGSIDVSGLLADWDTSWPEHQPTVETAGESAPPAAETAVDPQPAFERPERMPGPLTAAARAGSRPAADGEPVESELEWQWIEAAASAWLSRHEGSADSDQNNPGASSW